jgi:hypothetical protein
VQRLEGLQASLPKHAWFGYLGVLPGRLANSFRATVSGLGATEIVPFLREIKWCGDSDAISGAADIATLSNARITLALDIGQSLGQRVGIELAPRINSSRELCNSSSRELCNSLLGLAGVSNEIAEALSRWHGVTCYGDDHWRDALREALWGIVRRLNHIKLAYEGSKIVAIKRISITAESIMNLRARC